MRSLKNNMGKRHQKWFIFFFLGIKLLGSSDPGCISDLYFRSVFLGCISDPYFSDVSRNCISRMYPGFVFLGCIPDLYFSDVFWWQVSRI
jgi:hypothetical protein